MIVLNLCPPGDVIILESSLRGLSMRKISLSGVGWLGVLVLSLGVSGCGRIFPYVMILPTKLSATDWAALERHIDTLRPGPGHVFHVRVHDPSDDVSVQVDIPLWIIRSTEHLSSLFVDLDELEGCDELCQKAVRSLPWEALTMRGTSIFVYTPEEKVAIWVD